MEGGMSAMKIRSETVTSGSAVEQVDQRRWDASRIQKDLVEPNGDIMSWIRSKTDSLCDLAEEYFMDPPPHTCQILHLVVELTGWRSYLSSILSLGNDLDSEGIRIVSGELSDLMAQVDRLLAAIDDNEELLEDANKHTFGEHKVPLHLQCSLKLILKHSKALSDQESPAAFTTDQETTTKGYTSHMAGLKKPTLRDKAVPMKPCLRAVAAGGSKVSPFHLEMSDLKAAVAALSGPPMAKLKMQTETEDEVLLVWEAGDSTNVEPPPAAANIRTHVLSAQLKGHDTDNGGRVDYQLFSPLIDFNLEEESSLQPGRHTDAPAPWLKSSANVLSILVAESGRGFPLSLYGSVLVTDALDDKGIYLFRRERDDPQIINSKDEALFLVGPCRGLVVFDYLTFEFDIKMRLGDQQADDLDFSKGTIEYNSIFSDPPFISDKLSSPLSTIELNYAPVRRALEATVEIQIVQDSSTSPASSTKREDVEDGLFGKLYGKISACYTSGSKEIVLFDSDAYHTMFMVGDDGVLELWRRVLSVCVQDSLVLTVETWGDDHGGLSRVVTKSSFVFTPLLCGEGRAIVPCDGFKMQLKVVWSALYIPELDD